jgi:hypothetical protein
MHAGENSPVEERRPNGGYTELTAPAPSVLSAEAAPSPQPGEPKGHNGGPPSLFSRLAEIPPFLILLATLALFSFPVLGAWLNLLPAKVAHVIRNFSEALVKLS